MDVLRRGTLAAVLLEGDEAELVVETGDDADVAPAVDVGPVAVAVLIGRLGAVDEGGGDDARLVLVVHRAGEVGVGAARRVALDADLRLVDAVEMAEEQSALIDTLTLTMSESPWESMSIARTT